MGRRRIHKGPSYKRFQRASTGQRPGVRVTPGETVDSGGQGVRLRRGGGGRGEVGYWRRGSTRGQRNNRRGKIIAHKNSDKF